LELLPDSVVVYRKDVFDAAGISAPETFEELELITGELAASGTTPWCLGLGGEPPASLMPMIQTRVIDLGGIALHDAWIQHEIPADHPLIVEAHRQVGDLLFENAGDKGSVRGRPAFDVIGLRANPAQCAMWTTWNWVGATDAGGVLDDPRLGTFLIPATDPTRTTMIVGGVGAVVLTDSPETRSMIRLFTSPFFGRQLAEGAGTVAANLRIPPDEYTNPVVADLAERVRATSEQDQIRLGMPSVVPIELIGPYFQAIEHWFDEGPDALEGILADLDDEWTAIESAQR
jgi:alpha-glucoside transport system substrate-binding protein